MVGSALFFYFRATNQLNQTEEVTAHHHTEHLPQGLWYSKTELPLLQSLISNRMHQAATFLEVTELIMVVKSGPCKHQETVKHFADQRLCSSKGFTTNMLHAERRDEYTILFDTTENEHKICRQMTLNYN